jgi:hypothetical protein
LFTRGVLNVELTSTAATVFTFGLGGFIFVGAKREEEKEENKGNNKRPLDVYHCWFPAFVYPWEVLYMEFIQ